MKVLYLALAAASTSVCDANIFQRLLDKRPVPINLNGREMQLVESTVVPGTYFYSLAKTQPNNTVDMYLELNTITRGRPSPEIVEQITKELQSRGFGNVQVSLQYEEIEQPGSLPTVELPTVDNRTEQQKSRDMVYGDDGIVNDPFVLDAWDKVDEAERKLREHREYMKKVLKSRKSVSDQKKKEAGLESTEFAEAVDNKI